MHYNVKDKFGLRWSMLLGLYEHLYQTYSYYEMLLTKDQYIEIVVFIVFDNDF